MNMTLEERTLIESFRNLDEAGKKDMLRLISLQRKKEPTPAVEVAVGQCQLKRGEEKPEAVAEPIFTE